MAIQHDTEAGPSSPRAEASQQAEDSAAAGPSDSDAGSRARRESQEVNSTCDSCRVRKVRCLSLTDSEVEQARSEGKGSSCRGCYRRKEDCVFEYRYKKPGRPKGSLTKRPRRTSSAQSPSRPSHSPSISSRPPTALPLPPLSPPPSATHQQHNTLNYAERDDGTPQRPPAVQHRSYLDVSSYASVSEQPYGPATGTIFGSALTAMTQGDSQSIDIYGTGSRQHGYPSGSGSMYAESHAPIQGILGHMGPDVSTFRQSQVDPYRVIPVSSVNTTTDHHNDNYHTSSNGTRIDDASPSGGRVSDWILPRSAHSSAASPAARPFDYPSLPPHQTQTYASTPSLRPPYMSPPPSGSGTASAALPQVHPATPHDIPQIEAVAAWSDICFFVSLHMRHQHGLMPLVHKPTFAQDVLQRRDVADETFRGLLCSIVAYTICQSPINIVTPPYSRQDLEVILRRCQKTSRAIQLRWHMSPSLESLASLQLDINTALAATQVDLATALISDARRQVYALGLHTAQPKDGLSVIQLQICRRLFWEIYQSDKTNVMNAISAISLNDLEGVPPLPLEIDDDYITTSVATPQPDGQVSYMTGFVVISRIFQILGQCQIRQKTFANNRDAGPPREKLLMWVEEQRIGMRRLLGELPGKLRAEWREAGGFERAEESSLGIQRANIHITALCVELALLDFRVHLDADADTRTERESLARKAYATLSNVPIEYLASNGESMRGKVLRIVLDLLSMTKDGANGEDGQMQGEGAEGGEGQAFGKDVWDWWNMYSSVQFFQVIPEISAGEHHVGSRRASPGR